MQINNVVVIGASAGGIAALRQLVAGLPADFKAPVFVVQHLSPTNSSYLDEILSVAGPLPARRPEDGDKIEPGVIYVAPPDYHMLIENDTILVKKGPKENRFRPSVDALFRSAAYNYKTGVVAVVLSGMLDDGTSGMWTVKRLGGLTVIQEPEEAQFASMPNNVLKHVEVDHRSTAAELGPLLTKLINRRGRKAATRANAEKKRIKLEIDIAAQRYALDSGLFSLTSPSRVTCPECGGVLFVFSEGKFRRYRCHTGHAYTDDSLYQQLSEKLEDRFWQTLRSLEEVILQLEETASNAPEGNEKRSQKQRSKAQRLRRQAKSLKSCLDEHLADKPL